MRCVAVAQNADRKNCGDRGKRNDCDRGKCNARSVVDFLYEEQERELLVKKMSRASAKQTATKVA